MFIKWSSLQKSVSKFTLKWFMRSTPGLSNFEENSEEVCYVITIQTYGVKKLWASSINIFNVGL